MEITEPLMFPQKLAAKIGMRLGPSNVEDMMLGYLSSEYKHYYELPSSTLKAVDIVTDTFKGATKRCTVHNTVQYTLYT